MTKEVIRVENISKLYRLGEVGTGTLSHDLNRWWAKLRGKEDPFAKVARVNERSGKSNSRHDYVWALKDIDFSVEPGEVLGIIGRNGAGKSTLLKIISRITAPTQGNIKVKGRIGSLLEVGTGFHPEMTGRENIFMNGTLLGMRRREIQNKLEEIVEFAGVALYLDTPVKRYSSGMMVRLGFAVAAFLEPEILIVDEVLSVGDAEFQKKALGRMQDVSKNDGRTVLFVSHNIAAVKSLCNKGLLLENGISSFFGSMHETIDRYTNNITQISAARIDESFLGQEIIDGFTIEGVNIYGKDKSLAIRSGEEMQIEIIYTCNKKFVNPGFVFQFKDQNELELIRLSNMPISGYPISKLYSRGIVHLRIDKVPFVKGCYTIDFGFVRERVEWYFNLESLIVFQVEGNDVYNSGFELDRTRGLVWATHSWNHIQDVK